MTDSPRILLIGGTSHTGKSTLAELAAARLGWRHESTDLLARHPGRPWQVAPEREAFVVAHYIELPIEELLDDVLRHYRETVWPLVEQLLEDEAKSNLPTGLVLEGSALLPELVATLPAGNTLRAVWLSAGDEVVTRRIWHSSGYGTLSELVRAAVDKFIARTMLYNDVMIAGVRRMNGTVVEVSDGESRASACERVLQAAGLR